MKLKITFMSLLLTLILFGCAKKEDPSDKEDNSDLQIVLPSPPVTYAMEGQHDNSLPIYYEDVTVFLGYGGTNVVTYKWSDAEIKAKAKTIDAAGSPVLVFVVVNGKTLVSTNITTSSGISDAYKLITVDSQNEVQTLGAEDPRGNIAGYYGSSQTVTLTGNSTYILPHQTLPNTKVAKVDLYSMMSRFEMGTLKHDPTEFTSFRIDKVYSNNYFTSIKKETIVKLSGDGWITNKPTSGWSVMAGSDDVTSISGTKVYAFNVIAGSLVPHIVYEVSGTLASGKQLQDGTVGDFVGRYITISGFTGISASIAAHHVYQAGLTGGGIPITIGNITSIPERNHLILEIVKKDWGTTTVTPLPEI